MGRLEKELFSIGQMKETLTARGAGFGHIIKMQAFLVGDPEKGGQMDFAGFNDGYAQFFGTADQPNVPARPSCRSWP